MAGNSKNALTPFHLIIDGAMSASITSAATNIQYLDNVSIQLNFTTSDAVGTFSVQGSLDHAANSLTNQQITAGNWVTITLPTSPVAASADNQILLDLNQLSFPWIRVVYTRSSGSGTLNAYISAKAV